MFDAGLGGGVEDGFEVESAGADFAEHIGFDGSLGGGRGCIRSQILEVEAFDAAFPLGEDVDGGSAGDGGPEDIEFEADALIELGVELVDEAGAFGAGEFEGVVVVVEFDAALGAEFGGAIVGLEGGLALLGEEHAGADALDAVLLGELDHGFEGGATRRSGAAAGAHEGVPFVPGAGDDSGIDKEVDGLEAGVGDHGGVLEELNGADFEQFDTGGLDAFVGGGGLRGEGSADGVEIEADGAGEGFGGERKGGESSQGIAASGHGGGLLFRTGSRRKGSQRR